MFPKKALTHYKTAMELAKKNDHQGAIDELKLAIADIRLLHRHSMSLEFSISN